MYHRLLFAHGASVSPQSYAVSTWLGKPLKLCQGWAMRVVCPECFASYQVESVVKNAVLVCHRCQTEFDSYGNRIIAGDATTQFYKEQEEQAPTFGLKDLVQSGMKKRKQHIWLWMSLILLLVASAGFAANWEQWYKHGLIRGYSLQMQDNTPILDSDWEIDPSSVKTEWLKRKDGSLALIIEGKVDNQVSTALPTPEVEITFVTQTGENPKIIQPITEPTDVETLTTVPFASPAVDIVPVPALSSRGFILLIEDVPLSTQHVVLHAIPVQRRGQKQL